jgi:hypothetical protein
MEDLQIYHRLVLAFVSIPHENRKVCYFNVHILEKLLMLDCLDLSVLPELVALIELSTQSSGRWPFLRLAKASEDSELAVLADRVIQVVKTF